MRYVIESMQQWGRVFTDPDYWRPMIEHILEKHDLGDLRQIRAGYPGSNAVFWVNDAFIVKIFGQAWKEDFDRELELYRHLAAYDSLLVPKVMADGTISAGQEWKYMVMEGLGGERLGDVWKDVPRDNQLEIGAHLGKIVKQLHSVPVDGIRSMEIHLRHIEEMWETSDSGNKRNMFKVCYELYRQTQKLDASEVAGRERLEMQWHLPGDAGLTTCMDRQPLRYWQLEMQADTPGVPYHRLFLVPVYAR